MTVEVQDPIQLVRYVDQNGRLTLEGIILIQRLVDAIADLEARVTALEP